MTEKHGSSRPRTIAGIALTAAGGLACTATVAGFAAGYHWFLSLFSHFHAQYFVTLLIIAPLLLWTGRSLIGIVYLGAAAVNLLVVLPYYAADTHAKDQTSGRSLRAVFLNANAWNREYLRIHRFIVDTNPDIVVLVEATPALLHALLPLQDRLKYAVKHPRQDPWGIALLSHHPIVRSEIYYLGGISTPSLSVTLSIDTRRVTVHGVHLANPLNRRQAEAQWAQIRDLRHRFEAMQTNLILLGDFNTTPWSMQFTELLKTGVLRDSAHMSEVGPTWPSNFFPLSIPIDHCLVSSNIEVLKRQVGEDVGSDHLPLVLDLALH